MNRIIESLPVSDALIAVVSIGIIAAMAFVMVRKFRERSSRRELESVYARLRRDDELLQKLKNYDRPDEVLQDKPYEVLFESEAATGKEAKDSGETVKLQLVVRTDFSVKKFIADVGELYTIGHDRGNNLILEDEGVSPRQCALMNRGGLLYACDLKSAGGTVLSRKMQRRQLGENPVRILQGDVLLFADAAVTVNLIGG